MNDEEEMEAGKSKKEQIEALRAAGAQPTILTEEYVRELLEHSMPAPWVVYSEEGPVRLPSGDLVKGWTYSICADRKHDPHVCIGMAYTSEEKAPEYDAWLMAAAPDLARTVLKLYELLRRNGLTPDI